MPHNGNDRNVGHFWQMTPANVGIGTTFLGIQRQQSGFNLQSAWRMRWKERKRDTEKKRKGERKKERKREKSKEGSGERGKKRE